MKRTTLDSPSIEGGLFALAVIASIILRISMVPGDMGGSFVQLVLSGFGLVFFGIYFPLELRKPFPFVARITILPIAVFVAFAFNFFHHGTLVPFIVSCFAIAGIIGFCWQQKKTRLRFCLLFSWFLFCFGLFPSSICIWSYR